MSATGDLDEATVRRVETFLDRWIVREAVPGASVAVVDRDGPLHATGIGARDVAAKKPATPDTLYPFASVTKTVTGLAVAVLVDRGDLSFDAEIREYTDYWNDVPGDPITVGDLLTHSSGMADDLHADREYLFADSLPTSPTVTREDHVRYANGAADRRIVDEERFMYSDLGFAVLGEVVEAVDGREFAAFVEDEVFDPLGMNRSRVGYGDHAAVDEDAAQGYVTGEGEPEPTEFALEGKGLPPHSAGGLLSSVREMGRLLRCVINGGELDGTRILDGDLVEAMCSHQAPDRWSIDGDARGYGYGWLVDESPRETVVCHGGTAPGVSHAYVGFLPDRGLGVALAFNATGFPKGEIGRGILGIVAGHDPVDFVPALALREKVDAVTGTYEGYLGGRTATVGAEGSTVTVTFDGGEEPDLRAFPESTDRDDYSFSTVEGHVRIPVTFHDSDRGMELRVGSQRLFRTNG